MSRPIITGTGLYHPENVITNDELVKSYNAFADKHNAENAAKIARGEAAELQHSSTEFIERASGIKQRYVEEKEGILDIDRMLPRIRTRNDDELSLMAEYGYKAGKQAIEAAGLQPEDIDLVICAASNFERPYPAIAVEVQEALGCTNAYGYDMNVACSSATFGLDAAQNQIRSGQVKRALMINPELCTCHLNFENRDCHFIFGDVCTAVVLESDKEAANKEGWEILSTKCQTKFSRNVRNDFGYMHIVETPQRTGWDNLFKQNGRQVFREVCPMVANLIKDHLEENNLTTDDMARYWLHQANEHMNSHVTKALTGGEIDRVRAPLVLDEFANTAAAGSIIAFHRHQDGLVKGQKGIICSFGAGYSAGSILVERV
ncbi:MAG: beta-ketoacyl-ACP synthase III [Alphaproteobacteria bacterium]